MHRASYLVGAYQTFFFFRTARFLFTQKNIKRHAFEANGFMINKIGNFRKAGKISVGHTDEGLNARDGTVMTNDLMG